MARPCPQCESPLEDLSICRQCGWADGNSPTVISSPENRAQPQGVAAPYMPDSYWQSMHQIGGLAGVASPHLPETLNRWFYKNWAGSLGRFVTKRGLTPRTVFDVGAGTGFWLDWWLRHGAEEVAGCDLVPLAVERLQPRFGSRVTLVDVSSQPITGVYELVSVMNVLLHITDGPAFKRALENVAAAVAPGGYLLLMEPLVTGPSGGSLVAAADANSLARPADAYIAPLCASGLELVVLKASTAIGSDPIEKGRRSYRAWRAFWNIMRRGTRKFPQLASAVGWLICAMDPVLLRLGAAPSEKFALFRRP